MQVKHIIFIIYVRELKINIYIFKLMTQLVKLAKFSQFRFWTNILYLGQNHNIFCDQQANRNIQNTLRGS